MPGQWIDVRWQYGGEGSYPHSESEELTRQGVNEYWRYQSENTDPPAADTLDLAEVYNNDVPATYVAVTIFVPDTSDPPNVLPAGCATVPAIEPPLTLPATTGWMDLISGPLLAAQCRLRAVP